MLNLGLLAVVGAALAAAHALCPKAIEEGWRHENGALFSPAELEHRNDIDLDNIHGFTEVVAELKRRGATVVVLLIPPRPLVLGASGLDVGEVAATYQGARQLFRGMGMEVPDLLAAALSMPPGPERFFRLTDPHWSQSGARLAAEAAAAAVRGLPVAGRLGAERFQSELAYNVDAYDRGGWSGSLAKVCGQPVFTEKIQVMRTRPLAEAAVGLLDEVATPPVTMLASSYGIGAYGLPGFLSESLGSSVLPIAVGGGQVFTPLRVYLASDEYGQGVSPLVVWVIDPAHLSTRRNARSPGFREATTYRQLTAAVHGSCDAKRAVRVAEKTAGPGRTVLHTGLSGVEAGSHYLQLDAAALKGQSLEVFVRYASGVEETVEVRPDGRTPPAVRRFVSFQTGLPAQVTDVAVVLAKGAPSSTVSATVCRTR